MFGNATLTMVVSSTSMNVGNTTAAAISHGFTLGVSLLMVGKVVVELFWNQFTRTFGSTDMPGPSTTSASELSSSKILTGTR